MDAIGSAELPRAINLGVTGLMLILFSAATISQNFTELDKPEAETVKYNMVSTCGDEDTEEAKDSENGSRGVGKLDREYGEEDTQLQTNAEAVYNIVNMYVGVGLWSLPYSLVVGGTEALLVLLVSNKFLYLLILLFFILLFVTLVVIS